MFEVDVTGAIGTIHGAVDHAHVALVLRTRCGTRRRTRLRLALCGGCFRELLVGGAVVESDHLSVRGPLWTTSAARQGCELKRLPPRRCPPPQHGTLSP